MDFEKQKPVSDEYRNGYERVFGAQLTAKNIRRHLKRLQEEAVREYPEMYPNGCPMLNESETEENLVRKINETARRIIPSQLPKIDDLIRKADA